MKNVRIRNDQIVNFSKYRMFIKMDQANDENFIIRCHADNNGRDLGSLDLDLTFFTKEKRDEYFEWLSHFLNSKHRYLYEKNVTDPCAVQNLGDPGALEMVDITQDGISMPAIKFSPKNSDPILSEMGHKILTFDSQEKRDQYFEWFLDVFSGAQTQYIKNV